VRDSKDDGQRTMMMMMMMKRLMMMMMITIITIVVVTITTIMNGWMNELVNEQQPLFCACARVAGLETFAKLAPGARIIDEKKNHPDL
jgi:hypothetical protein